MIKHLIYLQVVILVLSACSKKVVSTEQNKELDFVYATLKNDAFVKEYNVDSTCVIIYERNKLLAGEPLRINVLDIANKKLVFSSDKSYYSVNWNDNSRIVLRENKLPVKTTLTGGEETQKKYFDIKTRKFVKPSKQTLK